MLRKRLVSNLCAALEGGEKKMCASVFPALRLVRLKRGRCTSTGLKSWMCDGDIVRLNGCGILRRGEAALAHYAAGGCFGRNTSA